MTKTHFKLGLSILASVYCFYYFFSIDSWHFIDNVNLIIHESGHYIFFIFGQFISIAGGSIMQLIMPAIFAFSFFRTGQNFSISIMLYWLAINFFSVGHYVADAIYMNLPLLGGENVIHDWNYLLSSLKLLGQTQTMANIIYGAGILCIFIGLMLAYQAFQYENNKIVV